MALVKVANAPSLRITIIIIILTKYLFCIVFL